MHSAVTRRQIMHTGVAAAVLAIPPVAGLASNPAMPLPAAVQSALPDVRKRGSARMRFLGLSIYDAHLWVPDDFLAERFTQSPLALDLHYKRNLRGALIAERSLQEMQRGGAIDSAVSQRWLRAMEQAFPDVRDGDRLTGVHTPGQGAQFYFNGQASGSVADGAFSERFFGIWLAPWSSEPQLRSQLLAV